MAKKSSDMTRYAITLNGVAQEGTFTADEIGDKLKFNLALLTLYGPVKLRIAPAQEVKE